MALTHESKPATEIGHRDNNRRRWVGAALLALGLLLPGYAAWSRGSLADDLALEINVPVDYTIVKLETSNFGLRSDHLALAKIQTPDTNRSSLRAFLRDDGFVVHRAEPEEWIRPRSDGYDATIWRVSELDPAGIRNRGAGLAIEARTFEVGIADLLPFALVAGLVLQLAGAAILRSALSRITQAATIALLTTSTLLFAVSLRALTQGKALIDAHQSSHGRLPVDSWDLAQLGREGTIAEQQLPVRLGTVNGLYPFGYLTLLVAIAGLGSTAALVFRSSRARALTVLIAVLAGLTAVLVFGESANLIVNILE